METKDILHTVKRIHMVGIGGSGMSPIAEILHARGYQLTGSDVNESDNIARLRSLRIPIFMGRKTLPVRSWWCIRRRSARPTPN